MHIAGVITWLVVVVDVLLMVLPGTQAQEPAFELPVELVGFPVIIAAVRLSNFVKKLAYSLNPKTYVRRSRRATLLENSNMIDMIEAEKRLVQELGDNVCIYTKVCLHHANKSRRSGQSDKFVVDWDDIFSNYKKSEESNKEFYLLSVFLGDFIASPQFCNQLAKRGRACTE